MSVQTDKWAPLEQSSESREKIWSKNRTFAGDVWFRFRRKPTAIAGLVMILLFLLFSLLGPMFTTYSYSDQNLAMVNIPPLMKVYDVGSCRVYISPSLKLIQVDGEGNLSGVLSPIRTENEKSMMIFDCGAKEVALYYGSSSYVVCDEATGNIYPSGYH